MNDAQIVDLHDVEAYLKSRKLVDDRHPPYYIRWVQRFLTGPGGDSRLSAEDAHRAFLERLNQSGAVPEWQIRQASRAVELFQKHYLRYRVEATPAAMVKDGELPSASAMPSNLEAGMGEVRRLARLRHYSYRTEQTYLGWLSQYGGIIMPAGS